MSQTSDVPVEVVIAAFNEEDGAEKALRELKEVRKEGLIGIQNAAVLWKDDKGKLRFKETADMRGGKGATIGGVIGGVVGLIFPPSILASAAVGAAIGGLSAKLRDSGFPDERLREVGEGLKPNTSALIAVIEHVWVRDVEEQLQRYATSVVTEAVRADIASQLEETQIPVAGSGEEAPAEAAAPESSQTPPPTAESSEGSSANPA
ncbi:MAG TPA: DUF1269 domain-containing protein [Ktedonobacterales bacterium]